MNYYNKADAKLFLTRAGFNGMMRFNKKGDWDIPFCKKPERFALAYITNICTQVAGLRQIIASDSRDFKKASFVDLILQATFNCAKMEEMNNGKRMPDVWQIPIVRPWEMRCGQHPTQKPLKLLHRIILASTRPGELILDPFAVSFTTGIAANLLVRDFIGIDKENQYLRIGNLRRQELENPDIVARMIKMLQANPSESTVIVNHARKSTKEIMLEKGICYLRAGDSKGSLLVKPGFEKLQYILIHTNGEGCHLYKTKKQRNFPDMDARNTCATWIFPIECPILYGITFQSF